MFRRALFILVAVFVSPLAVAAPVVEAGDACDDLSSAVLVDRPAVRLKVSGRSYKRLQKELVNNGRNLRQEIAQLERLSRDINTLQDRLAERQFDNKVTYQIRRSTWQTVMAVSEHFFNKERELPALHELLSAHRGRRVSIDYFGRDRGYPNLVSNSAALSDIFSSEYEKQLNFADVLALGPRLVKEDGESTMLIPPVTIQRRASTIVSTIPGVLLGANSPFMRSQQFIFFRPGADPGEPVGRGWKMLAEIDPNIYGPMGSSPDYERVTIYNVIIFVALLEMADAHAELLIKIKERMREALGNN